MGRPKAYGTDTRPVSSRLRISTYEQLRDEAQRQERSVARLIGDAVESYLAHQLDDFEPMLRPDCPSEDQQGLNLDEAAA